MGISDLGRGGRRSGGGGKDAGERQSKGAVQAPFESLRDRNGW
jgi:hypothetical protein